MESVASLRLQHADLFASMYREGILDEQFVELHQLIQPENSELSLRELADLFYQDSEKRLHEVAVLMKEQEVNYSRLKQIVRNFRETYLSFGTRRLINTCDEFIACYNANNFARCVGCLERLEDEYSLFKRKLETLLQLEHQILAAGETSPIITSPRMSRMLNPSRHRVYAD